MLYKYVCVYFKQWYMVVVVGSGHVFDTLCHGVTDRILTLGILHVHQTRKKVELSYIWGRMFDKNISAFRL